METQIPMAHNEKTEADEIISGWRAVERLTGRSRVQLWRDVRAGLFPAPIELGVNSIGWPRSEIKAWLADRPRRTYGRPAR